MKKDQLKALKGKSEKELEKALSGKKLELAKFFSKSKSDSGKNLKVPKNLRREIAQILTVVKENEIIGKESKK